MNRSETEDMAAKVRDANELYHNQLAGEYDDRLELYAEVQLRHYREIFRAIFESIDKANPSVLDVGCGTGYAVQFAIAYTRNITGIDISENMLTVARRRFPQVHFIHGSLDHPEVKNSMYDIVTSNALLHHLFDYDEYLVQISKFIKEKGTLFIGYEPNALAFKLFKSLRMTYRTFFPERRAERAKHQVNLDEDIETLAEYHQYFSDGISPVHIKNKLRVLGFQSVSIVYSNVGAFANLTERTGVPFLDYVPVSLMKLSFPLAMNFHIIATGFQPCLSAAPELDLHQECL